MPDAAAIDSIFRLLDRPVWIVTAADGRRRGGLVATWVAQASLDPAAPTLLAGIAPNHFTCELIDARGAFAVHLLEPRQTAVALAFALGTGRERDKLADVAHAVGETGSPLLADCLACLECHVIDRHDVGDRVFFLADVIAGERRGEGPPLTEQQLLTAATADERARLKDDWRADIELQRPLRKDWRAGLKIEG
jgi:flavin reductase (DIM6/NTAB) family NADH-FMN oxidoreductase RutF